MNDVGWMLVVWNVLLIWDVINFFSIVIDLVYYFKVVLFICNCRCIDLYFIYECNIIILEGRKEIVNMIVM